MSVNPSFEAVPKWRGTGREARGRFRMSPRLPGRSRGSSSNQPGPKSKSGRPNGRSERSPSTSSVIDSSRSPSARSPAPGSSGRPRRPRRSAPRPLRPSRRRGPRPTCPRPRRPRPECSRRGAARRAPLRSSPRYVAAASSPPKTPGNRKGRSLAEGRPDRRNLGDPEPKPSWKRGASSVEPQPYAISSPESARVRRDRACGADRDCEDERPDRAGDELRSSCSCPCSDETSGA